MVDYNYEFSKFVCEFCSREFDSERKAIKCEEYHIEYKDKFFFDYEDKRCKLLLKDASSNPSQRKLI